MIIYFGVITKGLPCLKELYPPIPLLPSCENFSANKEHIFRSTEKSRSKHWLRHYKQTQDNQDSLPPAPQNRAISSIQTDKNTTPIKHVDTNNNSCTQIHVHVAQFHRNDYCFLTISTPGARTNFVKSVLA